MDLCIVNRLPLRRTVVFHRAGHQAALIDKRSGGQRRYELQLCHVPPRIGTLFLAAFGRQPARALRGFQDVSLVLDFEQLDALRASARMLLELGDGDPLVAQLGDDSVSRGAVACLLAALHPALVAATLMRVVTEARNGRTLRATISVVKCDDRPAQGYLSTAAETVSARVSAQHRVGDEEHPK
jgi:hypothetical protein